MVEIGYGDEMCQIISGYQGARFELLRQRFRWADYSQSSRGGLFG